VVRSSRVIPTWDGRTARLEIENLELEDAGLYTCVAENEVGRTRCSARLVVLEKDDPSQEDRRPPVFLQELPAEVVATDGDMLDLQVRLEGGCSAEIHSVYCRDSFGILQTAIRCTADSHSLYCRQPFAVLQTAIRCTLCLQMCCNFIKINFTFLRLFYFAAVSKVTEIKQVFYVANGLRCS
jgi:hypothetical protein